MTKRIKIISFLSVIIFFTFMIPVNGQPLTQRLDMPELASLKVKLPVTFSWINFEEPGEEIPSVALERVKQTIIDFYLGSNGGDSTDISKAKDGYFNTICMPLGNFWLYIVILRTPLSYAHCKMFLYDSVSNKVSKKTIDYNTWSMYNIEDNTMRRSDAYKGMHLNSDDLALAKKKKTDLLVKRLKSTVAASEMEEIVYRPNNLSLDTVSAKVIKNEEPIESGP